MIHFVNISRTPQDSGHPVFGGLVALLVGAGCAVLCAHGKGTWGERNARVVDLPACPSTIRSAISQFVQAVGDADTGTDYSMFVSHPVHKGFVLHRVSDLNRHFSKTAKPPGDLFDTNGLEVVWGDSVIFRIMVAESKCA